MEIKNSEVVRKDKYMRIYQTNLEKYFIRAIILEKLPMYDVEIDEYYKLRYQTERGYLPHLIAYATGVFGFHFGVLNRYVGKGLLVSKVLYYTTNALFLNGMIHYLVYQKCLKPYTEKLSWKYESFLLEEFPDLQYLKKNYRIEGNSYLENRT